MLLLSQSLWSEACDVWLAKPGSHDTSRNGWRLTSKAGVPREDPEPCPQQCGGWKLGQRKENRHPHLYSSRVRLGSPCCSATLDLWCLNVIPQDFWPPPWLPASFWIFYFQNSAPAQMPPFLQASSAPTPRERATYPLFTSTHSPSPTPWLRAPAMSPFKHLNSLIHASSLTSDCRGPGGTWARTAHGAQHFSLAYMRKC